MLTSREVKPRRDVRAGEDSAQIKKPRTKELSARFLEFLEEGVCFGVFATSQAEEGQKAYK